MTTMRVRHLFGVCAFLILLSTIDAAAQTGVTVSGRLLNSLSGDPIPDATVRIDELNRTVTSDATGTFTFDNVPAGTYHLSVQNRS